MAVLGAPTHPSFQSLSSLKDKAVDAHLGGRIVANLPGSGSFEQLEKGLCTTWGDTKALKSMCHMPSDDKFASTCGFVFLASDPPRLKANILPTPVTFTPEQGASLKCLLGSTSNYALIQKLLLVSADALRWRAVLVPSNVLEEDVFFRTGKPSTKASAPASLAALVPDDADKDEPTEYVVALIRGCHPIKNGSDLVQGTSVDTVHSSLAQMSESAGAWFDLATQYFDADFHRAATKEEWGGHVPNLGKGQHWSVSSIVCSPASTDEDQIRDLFPSQCDALGKACNALAEAKMLEVQAAVGAANAQDDASTLAEREIAVPDRIPRRLGAGERDATSVGTGSGTVEVSKSQLATAYLMLMVSAHLVHLAPLSSTLTFSLLPLSSRVAPTASCMALRFPRTASPSARRWTRSRAPTWPATPSRSFASPTTSRC